MSKVPPAGPARRRIDWVEVGVLVDAESVCVGTSGNAEVYGISEIPSLDAHRPLVAHAVAGRLLFQLSNGLHELAVYEAGDTVLVRPRHATTLVVVNGRRYRGALKIFLSPAGRVTVVNRVGLEDYLRGVLVPELVYLEPRTIEAGKAQAVAARTYALYSTGRRAREGFDLYDSARDQLYGGVEDEDPLADRCVRESEALVCTHSGRLILASYFSACGGLTANVEDVWPGQALPWLRSCVDADGENAVPHCAASPDFRWTEVWSISEFLEIVNRARAQRMGAQSQPASRLDDVRVRSRSASGRVAELVIETDVDSLVVRGDSTRRVLLRPQRSTGSGGGSEGLRSSLFKIGLMRDLSGLPLAVVATGAGYGHGVGLCQWGALGMARHGYDFREILAHYYTGIRIGPASKLSR